jgi:hypothetical protein
MLRALVCAGLLALGSGAARADIPPLTPPPAPRPDAPKPDAPKPAPEPPTPATGACGAGVGAALVLVGVWLLRPRRRLQPQG